MPFEIVRNDITKMAVDVIVNTAKQIVVRKDKSGGSHAEIRT